jgi:hypothetical protein
MALCVSGCGFFFPGPLEQFPDDDGGFTEAGADAGAPSDAGTLVHGIDPATCTFKGHKLYGKVQFVDSFADVKVRVVTSLPDFKVELVDALPTRCGQWQEVTSLPDLRVKVVDSLADLEIKYVTSFPGLP